MTMHRPLGADDVDIDLALQALLAFVRKLDGTEPVNLMAMGTLANAYRNTYTVTFGRGAEVSARWDKGVKAAKKLGEEGNVRRIAKYLISCVGTMNDALR